jgi:hypothetical protein
MGQRWAERFSGHDVPEPDGPILAAGHNSTVGAEQDVLDRTVMAQRLAKGPGGRFLLHL